MLEMNFVKRDKTSSQIGADLGISGDTIRRYAREGRIPFVVTPGGHRRFDAAEVRSALSRPAAIDVSMGLGKVHRARIAVGDGGSELRSEADRLMSAVRAVRTTPSAGAVDDSTEGHLERRPRPGTYLEEIFTSARRVLVGSVVR